jgi:malate dehydrogenase (oxaloacetate-decarboxylating)
MHGYRKTSWHRRGALTLDAPSVNFEVALAVIDQAVEEGVATADVPKSKEDRRKWAEARRWVPEYEEYEYDPKGRV